MQAATPDMRLNNQSESRVGAIRSDDRDTAPAPELNIIDLSTHVREHGPGTRPEYLDELTSRDITMADVFAQ